jgi:Glycosyl hydrolases family 35
MQYIDISVAEQIPLLCSRPVSSQNQSNRKRWFREIALLAFVLAFTILFVGLFRNKWGTESMDTAAAWLMSPPPPPLLGPNTTTTAAETDDTPCWFRAAAVSVPRQVPGFPSFWNYYSEEDCVRQLQPIHVSYDARALGLNGERVLLLGGSVHPSRMTRHTWHAALDEAVRQGLNLITIYVIWSAHQPFSGAPLDFTLQWNYTANGVAASAAWDLQEAIRDVANHGLWVHIRIGPYVCAEYNYGGIPEWLPLLSENMSMRRPNFEWMWRMGYYVTQVLSYLQQHKLFAYQGGPILLAQIENEIGSDMDSEAEEPLLRVDSNGHLVAPSPSRSSTSTASRRDDSVLRNATMQDYADWCGRFAQQWAPEVVWTMCSGLSANSTISTYNGFFENADDIAWLETYGDTHRIQVDQPALWTEHEGALSTYKWHFVMISWLSPFLCLAIVMLLNAMSSWFSNLGRNIRSSR